MPRHAPLDERTSCPLCLSPATRSCDAMFIVPADRLRTGKGRKGRSGKCGAQIARGRLRVDRDAAKKASCFRKKNRSTDLQTCASEHWSDTTAAMKNPTRHYVSCSFEVHRSARARRSRHRHLDARRTSESLGRCAAAEQGRWGSSRGG